ncbi:MAG: DNA polymerase I, partial [Gammaproteobacteria bacterium]
MASDETAGAANPPLLLVDGSSYLFRAYHALPELKTSTGLHTGAVRGVIGMLRRLTKDYRGSPIAVVFDAKGKTFRDDLYSDYKANRPPMPDDLREQIEPIHQIIEAMGLPLIVVPGVEADDVIGTLAAEATDKQRDTVISTSDKDMAQLVTEHVTLVNTMSETTLDPAGVAEKFGVPPELIIDYLALMGDSVDNIPGVPKVGPKTAAKWLNEYGDLDGVVASAEQIKGKVGESLRDHLDQLPLSKALTTIKCDVALDVGIDDLAPRPVDEDQLKGLFERLEFRTWLAEVGGAPDDAPVAAAVAAEGEYECVSSAAALDEWIERLRAAPLFSFDTETTSLNYMQAELVGVSFSCETGKAAYVPLAHDYPGAPDQLGVADALHRLKPLLEDPSVVKVGQNLKYDMSVLQRYDVQLAGVGFDTMLESYVLNSTASRHNMDDLAKNYLSRETIHYEDIAGKGAKQLTFNQVPVDDAVAYAAEDADITLQLHQTLWPRLEKEPRLTEVFRDIEMPLMPVLSRVERAGTLVDGALLEAHGRELAE